MHKISSCDVSKFEFYSVIKKGAIKNESEKITRKSCSKLKGKEEDTPRTTYLKLYQ